MEELKHPNFLDVVRMYRKERDIGYTEARNLAFKEFDKRNWPIPESYRVLQNRRPYGRVSGASKKHL